MNLDEYILNYVISYGTEYALKKLCSDKLLICMILLLI